MTIEHPSERAGRKNGPKAMWAVMLAAAFGMAAALVGTDLAEAVETRLAGSAQLDYLVVPTTMAARDLTFDGFTTELSLKLAVDVNDHVSASVKVCSSCHGLETGVAAVDLAINDKLSLRAGRFTPRFGDFHARHDPANHRTSDKPLPYDMGRMLRLRAWNLSVLPAPYVDNGVELAGHHDLGAGKDLDWSAFVVGGLRSSDGAADLDFLQSRSGERYYVDNNSQPAVGGRISFSSLGRDRSLRVGASAMAGKADPAAKLDYLLVGVDAVVEIQRWTLRAEYLLRRQRMGFGPEPASQYVYGTNSKGVYSTHFLKDGFYIEAERPLGITDVLLRFDGMTRVGNVLIGSPIGGRAYVLRSTAAVAIRSHERLRWKASAEWYRFSDFGDELAMHVGLVTAF